MKLPWVLLLLCIGSLGGAATANFDKEDMAQVSQTVVMQQFCSRQQGRLPQQQPNAAMSRSI